ncbi:hypothetical protein H4V97_000594 [Flavobacterium sp. CG_23.5]|nr:hypothetical protein [Flavobacterium sp. CG_23.5]
MLAFFILNLELIRILNSLLSDKKEAKLMAS